MPSAKPFLALAFLAFSLPGGVALAGLNVYPADGPKPALHVEEPKPLEYKVQKGDSVAGIAKKFSISSKELMAANGVADAKKLKIGQLLKIPGKAAAPKAVSVASVSPAEKPKAESKAETKAEKRAEAKAAAAAAAAETKADATARKARHRGEQLDPGIDEETPVKGKRGRRKGKFQPAPVTPPPAIVVDDKLRSSFGKTGVITNSSDVPQYIRDEFLTYAKKWVAELDQLGVGTFTHKKIHLVDGQWEASYRVIIPESIGAEVKRVQYEHTPYVGHITYVQRVYTCTAPTKQAALAGPFTSKDENIREIFSYSGDKKAWR